MKDSVLCLHHAFADRTLRRFYNLIIEHLTDGNVAVISGIGVTNHARLEEFAPKIVVCSDALLDVELLCHEGGKVGVVERIVRRKVHWNLVVIHSKL